MKNPFKPLSDTARNTIKSVAEFVVDKSVSGTVVAVVRQNVTVESMPAKASMYLGAYLIGSKVADVITEDVSTRLDLLMTKYNKQFEKKDETEVHVITTMPEDK